MNDRFLYRAKRCDTGEWVEGSLITGVFFRLGQEIPYMFCPNLADYDCFEDFSEENGIFEVDPSTICQCTGLRDKNGKLIWENDIVELYDRNTDYKWRAVVLFGNPNCEYTWGWQLKPIVECEANTDILCWIDMEESGAFCGVIGSAIDNPELLEK